MSDKPIDPQPFISGVKVVDIGDLRIARGLTRRPVSTCRHLNLVYDSKERRIWCSDCEQEVEAFDAFKVLCEFYSGAVSRMQQREEQLKQAEVFVARSRAVKALDRIWRTKDQVPCCPHCSDALLPEDMLRSLATVSARTVKAERSAKRLTPAPKNR